MTALFMLVTLVSYFLLLLYISRRTTKSNSRGNDAFFRGSRQSPWWMVAFGMIGASISGVTFISVPGWAQSTGMTYLQMCLGFIVGYALVAIVLLPLYYRLHLTSIYAYLGTRFGENTHRTGALFFVLSKLTGAAARLFLVCLVLNEFAVRPFLGDGLPQFLFTVGVVLLLIWGYTHRNGIQTLVRTDALQTLCLLGAAIGIFIAAAQEMNLNFRNMSQLITESPMCRIWEWDLGSKQAFWRQFISGVLIVVVMTGLDQDMMQKNLTCRSLRDAQKDMFCYGLAFVPVNALFLGLGIVLYTFAAQMSTPCTATGDQLLPALVSSGALGSWVIIPFTIGIVAAAFSSADSALTALTTTICIDLLKIEDKQYTPEQSLRLRRRVHLSTTLAFVICIVFFKVANNNNILNAIYIMASYTYGPLLGLYTFGLFTHRIPRDSAVPAICIAAPLICAILDWAAPRYWQYSFGYELLLFNGILTFAGLWLLSKKEKIHLKS